MQAWENFISSQEKSLGKKNVDKWLRSLKVIKYDACNVHLEAKDSFQLMWFEEHIRPKIRTQLINNNGHLIRVHISVSHEQPEQELDQTPTEHISQFTADPLEPHCHFSQYVPGNANKMPYMLLSRLVGTDPNERIALGEYNPIFLFGGRGCGKSHLLMALAQAFSNQGKKVFYVKAETFTDHVIRAFRSGLIQEFRQSYRNIDILLFDDVHLLEKKATTQEELFHTFNTLHTAGKQIVLTSLYSPRDLKGIEERLVSRFEWGITLPLQKLTEQELEEVIIKRCDMLQFPLKESLVHYLASRFTNHKSLSRAIEALILRTHVEPRFKNDSKRIDPEDAERLLADMLAEEERQEMTPERLLKIVAENFGVTIEDILSKSKSKEFVLPRQIAMYLCRTELKLPYLKIGSIFSRDHSTVMSSVRLISDSLKKQDRKLSSSFSDIQKRVLSS